MEVNSEHTDDVDGLVPLSDIMSNTHISVSSKYECVEAVATSVKSILYYQYKKTNSRVHNYFNYNEYIECITMEGHSEHTGSDDILVPLCIATNNAQISVSSKYVKSIMSSVTSADDETMYHE